LPQRARVEAPKRPNPLFLADAPALDFLNSIASPSGAPIDWLSSGEDLLDWLRAAELAPLEVLSAMRRSAGPGELDAVAAQARALREWYRGFVRAHLGKPLRSEVLRELTPLNRLLERDQEFGQITKRERGPGSRGGPTLAWNPVRRWPTPESLLIPIGRTMADLVCEEDFSFVKACEGTSCTLLMLDRTHARARRWCSMALCGNRAKQAAHRERERSRA
jgi:predicted RNA-binding Zn ribbon-like protein